MGTSSECQLSVLGTREAEAFMLNFALGGSECIHSWKRFGIYGNVVVMENDSTNA